MSDWLPKFWHLRNLCALHLNLPSGNPWGDISKDFDALYDAIVKAETAAYQKGMKEGWRWGHDDAGRVTPLYEGRGE